MNLEILKDYFNNSFLLLLNKIYGNIYSAGDKMKKRNIFIGNILKVENYRLIKDKKERILIKKHDYFIDLEDIKSGLDLLIEDYSYTCHGRHVFNAYYDAINEDLNIGVELKGYYFPSEEHNESISVLKLKKRVINKTNESNI